MFMIYVTLLGYNYIWANTKNEWCFTIEEKQIDGKEFGEYMEKHATFFFY
jgi:hypothetical protein